MKLHPIVDALEPNAEQIPAIKARGQDVVVTAGAGTGKTRTLVARFLSLLADGLSPREIVAITFTRRAAREMRNRVREAIDAYLRTSGGELDDRHMWVNHLLAFDAARIGTIHSLCSEILHSHPAEAGVDPRFSTLEEADSALLRLESLDNALAWAAGSPSCAELFVFFTERELREIIRSLLNQRATARAAFGDLAQNLLAHWTKVLSERQRHTLELSLQDPRWHEAQFALSEQQPSDPDDRIAQQRRFVVSALQAFEDASGWQERRAALSLLDEINLQGGSQKSWPRGKSQLQEVKNALRSLRDWWRAQKAFQTLEINEADGGLVRLLPSLYAVYERAESHYLQGLRERRSLDFESLEQVALQLLRENSDVCAWWQNSVRALLVDEYQDTNSHQRDLINLINGRENKLFIVGDAKQSIYRFRGAEIVVFRQERHRIAEQGRGFKLQLSYRAHGPLVATLNDILGLVLRDEEQVQMPWQEPFAPLIAARTEPVAGLEAPYCELHLTVGSKSRGALDQAADMLVHRLQELRATAGGSLNYGDMAILCRASTSFSAYENAMDRVGMPYVTVAGRGFFQRPEIRDLLNALQAIADPNDDLALVGLLRSPVSGIDDGQLLQLMDSYRTAENRSLWQWLTRELNYVSIADDRRLLGVVNLIGRLHLLAGRLSVADVLKSYLDDTGYRAALRLAGFLRSVHNVNKLLEVAHDTSFVSTSDFLEYVSTIRSGLAREGEAHVSGGDAVQLMSVHQAKGLEFPIVVLGDASYEHQSNPRFILDEDLGFVTNVRSDGGKTPAVFELALARERAQQEAESARLLYVAATRARDKLLVNGVVSTNRDDEVSNLRGWIRMLDASLKLGKQVVDIGQDGDGKTVLTLALGKEVDCTIYGPNYRAPDSPVEVWQDDAINSVPIDLGLLQSLHEESMGVDDDIDAPWWSLLPPTRSQSPPARIVGALVHEALSAWKFPASQQDEAFRAWLASRARQLSPFETGQKSPSVSRVTGLLIRLTKHSLFHTLQNAQARFHEIPFFDEGQESRRVGRMDILFNDGHEWTIVDFKTERIPSESVLEDRLQRVYKPQLARYAGAVQRLMAVTPRSIVCLLDYRGRVHVVVGDLTIG